MKKLILLFICFQTVMIAQSGQKNFIDQPYIEVNGDATIEVTPNEIYVSITLKEEDKSAKNAIESQEKKLISALKNSGINVANDLKVKDFTSSYKNYFLFKSDVRKTKEFELLVHNGKELNRVFGILESLRIGNSYIIKVDHSNIENIKLEANIKAITAAKNKSNAYSKALGQRTGKAIYIREQAQVVRGNYPMYENVRAMSKMESSADAVINPAFKNIIIKATVQARFILI